jgi:hypothetical protein
VLTDFRRGRPTRRAIFGGIRPDQVLVALVLIAAIPLVFHGVDQALIQRNSSAEV